MLITTAAILVTAVLCTWAYYKVFEREVRTDLAAYTVLLADRISLSGDEILSGGTGRTAKTEKTPTEEEERGREQPEGGTGSSRTASASHRGP